MKEKIALTSKQLEKVKHFILSIENSPKIVFDVSTDGIGTIIKVKDLNSGKEEDISEYENF